MKKFLIILIIAFFALSSFGQEDIDTTIVTETTIISRKANKRNSKNSRQIIRCEERLQDGIEAYQKNKFAQAVSYLSIARNECSSEMDSPDSIYYFLGLSYMKGKKYEDARMEFRTIIEEFPLSGFIENTYYLIAYSSFKAAPKIERDSRLLRRAEREFASFISAYPNSELYDSARVYLDSISQKLLEKEILVAEFYETIRKYESAVIYYQVILENNITSKRVPEIRLRLAENLIRAQRFAEAEEQLKILENENLYQNEIEDLRRRQNTKSRRI